VEQLWSPWRMAYILEHKSKECVFCSAFAAERDQDRAHLILHRGAHCAVIMNLFPYNNGHTMVVPYTHQPDFDGLSAEALAELMALVNKSVAVLRIVMDAQGFNIGVNIGKVAGAGIDDHVHMHVVPRWAGDTNFITTLGQVRCIPESLERSYDKLKAAWDQAA
jgi:ATP adenylyltransferase